MKYHIQWIKELGATPAEIRRCVAAQGRAIHNMRVRNCRFPTPPCGIDYEALSRFVETVSKASLEARVASPAIFIPERNQ